MRLSDVRRPILLAACLMTLPSDPAARAETPDAVVYTVRFPAPHTHYVEVEAAYPTAGRDRVELMMAVWTPGSYLIREFARHVEALTARSPTGAPLPVERTRKNRWRVATEGASSILVSYRVYGRELSVRTNWVEADFALLNGAPTFITLAETGVARRHLVRLELPPGWGVTMSGLPPADGGAPHHYAARDFDTLVDSPILAGNPTVHDLTVAGVPHHLVNEGERGVWDGPRSARDVERIVQTAARFWGGLPYDRYVILNLLTGASGGLEHGNSTVLMASRSATEARGPYLRWLSLVGHELFHAWNGKRLRPFELGPFDYEREVHTTSLWVVEGLTSYYADLLVRRAGLSTDDEYLHGLGGTIRQLQTTPGRRVQPLGDASYDAWIRYYRRDENTDNSTVSYYTKGAVVAFLLDAAIRQASGGERSLDTAMRRAYDRFSGTRGYTDAAFRETLSAAAGVDLGPWLHDAIDTTSELAYDDALAWYGLRFRPVPAGQPGRASLGVRTRIDRGRLIVTHVARDTAAHAGGLNVDDEILAIDDVRVRPERDQLDARLARYQPGDRVSMLVARRDALVRLTATLGEQPHPDRWRLEVSPGADAQQRANLRAWLDGPPPETR